MADRMIRLGAWLRRVVTRAVARLPYFPDPQATCPAHGARYCARCHRNPVCLESGTCENYAATGMHWDTCANRVRGSR